MAEPKDKLPEEQWDEISIEFVKFAQENDEVNGELIRKEYVTMRSGTDKETEVGKYTLQRPDGTKCAFLGGIQLDSIMQEVDVGETIKLRYTGREKTTSGYEVKSFKLFKKHS